MPPLVGDDGMVRANAPAAIALSDRIVAILGETSIADALVALRATRNLLITIAAEKMSWPLEETLREVNHMETVIDKVALGPAILPGEEEH